MPLRRRVASSMQIAGSGTRDRLVVIQARDGADSGDSTGYPIQGWKDLTAVFMLREDVMGDEVDAPTQTLSSVDTRWEMPYRADMDPELLDVPKLRRLRYRDRTYDIQQATTIGRARAIELFTFGNTRVEPGA